MADKEQEYNTFSTEVPVKTKRNWKPIIGAVVVILLVIVLIVVGCVLLSPKTKTSKPSSPTYKGSKIKFDEYLAGNFSGQSIGLKWIGQWTFVYNDLKNRSIMVTTINNSTLEITTKELLPHAVFTPFQVKDWFLSPDLHYIALRLNWTKQWRHSGFSAFTILDCSNTSNVFPVLPDGNETTDIRILQWNPVPRANDFVFVYQNDIWYQPSPSGIPQRITVSGYQDSNGFVYNGVPDWLYEEEILGSETALYWSPDGEYIAFIEFDDRDPVPVMEYPMYRDSKLYPQIMRVPYSKSGEPIPTVKLMLWSKNENSTMELKPPNEVPNPNNTGYYVFSVNWHSPGFSGVKDISVLVTWTDRIQNNSYVSLCSKNTGQCLLNYQQSYMMKGMNLWAMPDQYNIQYATTQQYFVLLPQIGTDDNIYTGISSISVVSGKRTMLHNGNFDVGSIIGFNSETNQLYFKAAAPQPWNNNVYMIYSNATDQTPQCMTCYMMNVDKSDSMYCGNAAASFNSPGSVYLLSCHGPNPSKQWLVIDSQKNLMCNNTKLANYVTEKAMPVIQYTNITLDNGYEALVQLEMPPGTDLTTTEEKYPMLLNVYGGPGSNIVGNSFWVSFNEYLASNRRYIIAKVDARGSGNRGWKYKSPMYHSFGTVEIKDQINTAKALASKYSFIDATKTAVWGWSYGGFATANIIAADKSKFFACGISVAPVTDFRYYDAAYTERYMGLPQTNPVAYANTDVIRNATNFQNRTYLLIHGTGDDNVHFQNSAMFIKALTKHNIQFSLMIYPNEQHSIGHDRRHLWHLVDNFLLKCFS